MSNDVFPYGDREATSGEGEQEFDPMEILRKMFGPQQDSHVTHYEQITAEEANEQEARIMSYIRGDAPELEGVVDLTIDGTDAFDRIYQKHVREYGEESLNPTTIADGLRMAFYSGMAMALDHGVRMTAMQLGPAFGKALSTFWVENFIGNGITPVEGFNRLQQIGTLNDSDPNDGMGRGDIETVMRDGVLAFGKILRKEQ